jgi:hypothetical protein
MPEEEGFYTEEPYLIKLDKSPQEPFLRQLDYG